MASPGPSNLQSISTLSSRTKSKPSAHFMGITAGAEDVKYQAKYKELKRKVKEIEGDNDKLHFKVLTAKRNIQRMKLERAILYERLAQISPLPVPNDQHSISAPHPVALVHHSPIIQPVPNRHRVDVGDLVGTDFDANFAEYSQPHSRINPGRPLPAIDTTVAPSVHHHIPPPSSRHGSGSGSESRQLPPFTQFLDQPRSPRSHPHPDSHQRTRSQSSSSRSHNLPPQQAPYHISNVQGHQYGDSLPPMQHALHSPPLLDREREGSRSRRHDLHELAGTHDAHAHSMPPLSPSVDSRSSARIHNHQRLGPGTYINRDDPRSHEMDRERDWEQERDIRDRELNYSNARQRERDPVVSSMRSPPPVHRRAPSAMDYHDQHIPSSRAREEYYHENSVGSGGLGGGGSGGIYALVSRSGTPGSGSGSNSAGANEGPSRPDSRSSYFEDRSRGYRFRHVNAGLPTNEEPTLDFVHEDGRSQSRDRSSATGVGFPPQHRETVDAVGRMDLRRDRESKDAKRKIRGDMDVDTEDGPTGVMSSYPGGISDERAGKRYHRDDNIEDVRMGP
ncbi:hypothetical protein F5876DRAFT_44927 [Lentinula aff. lateritia]|uniref:Uncharacterized protein n=1 Tax=Lentinula aff. lateritia TaxID=2804960 RepID=A0ACC1TW19_9AGAR|nr:hypothetical protein F5876DRAFT_44927 [Lentinula aff. lateritia]